MKKNKIVCILLALVLAFLLMPSQLSLVVASDSTKIQSKINGVSLTQKSTEGGGLMLEKHALSTLDFSNVTYLAIKFYNPTGAAWPFYWLIQQNKTILKPTNGTDYYVYDEDWTLKETKQVSHHAVAPLKNSVGYLVLPMSAFETLTTIEAVYVTLPAAAENQVGVTTLQFEKIDYYTGAITDFSKGGTNLVNFANWTEAWFNGRITKTTGVDCKLVTNKVVEETVDGNIDGIRITQINYTSYAEEGLMVNSFNNDPKSSYDLTNASYIGFEYSNLSTDARTGLIKLQDSEKNQAYPANGTDVIFLDKDLKYLKTKTTTDPYFRPDGNTTGWAIFPISSYTGLGKDLRAIYLLLNSYHDSLNGSAMEFGKIVVYSSSTITDYTDYTVIADPYSWDYSKYVSNVASTSSSRITTITRSKKTTKQQEEPIVEGPIECDFGDVRILEDMSTGYPTDLDEYNNTFFGKVDPAVGGLEVEKYDSIIDGDSIKLKVVEPIANRRDDYCAITFTAKSQVNKWYKWLDDDGKLEGVTFYVKNLSSAETTICFEIDEYDPEQDVAEDYRGERWSVGLGGRVLLYDTKTNEQSLIHSNPMISIPGNFEGWVRIPISCFVKAAWCTWGNSTFDMVRIAQFTVACYTPINMGNTFALDSIGLYYNQTVVQSIFEDNGNSILDNMQ